ncbi:MAG: type II toxin-antitoxin system VapC family toxin [Chloroflexi bacterium]|nr:type II toxin-antitoxin system VapC family toxin [Chloroflexota bacterium]
MTQYLLDTNHASPLITLDHPLRHQILAAIEVGHTFALPAVVIAELLFGYGLLPRASQNIQEWERLRPSFDVIAVEERDALDAAAIRVRLRRRGWQLNVVDALIVAIALRYGLTLLTTDGDFDAVPDLKYENWLPTV